MSRKKVRSPGTEEIDLLFPWNRIEDVPMVIRTTFRRWRIQREDLGLQIPITELLTLSEKDSDSSKLAKSTLVKIKRALINLLRIDSGLDTSDSPITEWTLDELIGDVDLPNSIGTDFTQSYARAARKSQRKIDAISARPGFNWRMLDKCWFTVVKSLLFWSPTELEEKKPAKFKRMMDSDSRKEALSIIESVGLGLQEKTKKTVKA
jgi:hypothetical protein